jgi:hypothetical protein
MNVNEERCMVTGAIWGYRREPAGRNGGAGLSGRPVPVHHVVARQGKKGLELLRTSLEGKGETLLVFSGGWAARGYLFAEAPGGGWYARVCTPGELISFLAGPCAGVGWVALDPRPGQRGEGQAPNVMPRENFVDYLLCLGAPFLSRKDDVETARRTLHEREDHG